MSRFWKTITLAPLAGAVALTGLTAVAPAQAASSGYTACVNKKTGETQLLLTKKAKRKKCASGWKKVRWSKAGRRGTEGNKGATGSRGPVAAVQIKDGTGALVGNLIGSLGPPFASITLYSIDTGTGIYSYAANGWVLGTFNPYYLNNTCTGTAYESASGPDELALAQAMIGTAMRLVYRQDSPTLGAPSAWKLSGGPTVPLVAGNAWVLSGDGACDDVSPKTSTMVPLESVTPPTDKPGPLTLD